MDGVLSQLRYSNDKSWLGYSKLNKPSSSKNVFVKASDQSNKEKVNKAKNVHNYPKRKRFVKKKPYVPRYKSNFVSIYFYYGISGHTPNVLYVRNFSEENGYHVWVKKGNNYEGPKAIWVPNKT